jgi:predicted phosphodiesterase
MSANIRSWVDGEYGIAHLSDLHFGSPHYDEVWPLTSQFLWELRPDLLLISGDLVDSPRKALYLEAKEAIDNLRIPYFVCAGNHDRFRRGLRWPAWGRGLLRVGCIPICAVAAILLWTFPWAWWAWLLTLAMLGVLLIALVWTDWLIWVLSRLWVDDHFTEVFQSKIVTYDELKRITIPRQAPGDAGNQMRACWTIGLFGDDSNASADSSARGYVPSRHFMPIRKATEGQDCELCLFLIHHHLLSIRRLEEDRLNKVGDLFNLTNMVNAGSLLETLASAHVDLVLHGHEHEHNFAAYGSIVAGSGTVKVVAAGSATGNQALLGCNKQRATFNILCLALDRSVRLGRYSLDAERWRYEEVDQIDAASLRLNRLRRRENLFEDLDSEISKFVEFTRERDIWVYWVYTNWRLPADEFTQQVINSSGKLEEALVRVCVHPSPPVDLVTTASRLPDRLNTWEIRAPIPEPFVDIPVKVELKYCWRLGAILTEDEMKQTAELRQERGTPRSRGYDFVTGWTAANNPVASLDLMVLLPQEYAPMPAGIEREVEVFVEHDGRRIEHQENELRPDLRILGKGTFALRVAYPEGDHDYQIAWKPISQRAVNELTQNVLPIEQFVEFVREKKNANDLLRLFRKQLKRASYPECSSVALYIRSDNGAPSLERVDCIGWTGDGKPGSHDIPPALIDLVGGHQILARAWWGESFYVPRPEDDIQALRSGFLPTEQLIVGLPIRLSLRSVNPPPWGVLRLGITDKDQDFQTFEKSEPHSTILLAAATVLLSAALAARYNLGDDSA